jgi:multidrug resistance efflux pump
LLTLGELDRIKLTVYVSERELGQIKVGQPVTIHIDSFPDRGFEGAVSAIADEAEFTPRNVQTQDERADTVFAVEIQILNPDHVIKPGVPADAAFDVEGG